MESIKNSTDTFRQILLNSLSWFIVFGIYVDSVVAAIVTDDGHYDRAILQACIATIILISNITHFICYRWTVSRAWHTVLICLWFSTFNEIALSSGVDSINHVAMGWITLTVFITFITAGKHVLHYTIAYVVLMILIIPLVGTDLYHYIPILEDYFENDPTGRFLHDNMETHIIQMDVGAGAYLTFITLASIGTAFTFNKFISKIMSRLEKEAQYHRHYARSSDIAAKELLDTVDRMNSIAEEGNIGLFEYDIESQLFISANSVFRRLYDLPVDEYPEISISDVLHRRIDPVIANTPEKYQEEFHRKYQSIMVLNDSTIEEGYRVYHRDGTRYNLNRSAMIIRDENGTAVKVVGSVYDVTNEYDKNEELKIMNHRDFLTGLMSRVGLHDHINSGKCETGWIFQIDLDFFKTINDAYGHDAGDLVIKETGFKIFKYAAKYDGIAARMGGEEFVLILPNDDLPYWQDAEEVGNQLLRDIRNHEFTLASGRKLVDRTASMGIAKLTKKDDVASMMTLADKALTYSKETGRNRVTLANADFAQIMSMRGGTITIDEIKEGILNDEIYYVAQPIVEVASNGMTRVKGFELLMRWNKHTHDGETLLSPEYYADRVDKIVEENRDRYMPHIIKAKRATIQAIVEHFPGTYVSVNMSVDKFAMPGGSTQIIETKRELIRGLLSPYQLVLEIIETPAETRYSANIIKQEMKRVKDVGFRIALDDFGKDHSNLNRLVDLPVDIIKFDKMIVDKIDSDSKSDGLDMGIKIISAVNVLCRRMGIETVAEGVSSSVQAQIIRSIKVDKQQGFIHSKPLTIEELTHYEAYSI